MNTEILFSQQGEEDQSILNLFQERLSCKLYVLNWMYILRSINGLEKWLLEAEYIELYVLWHDRIWAWTCKLPAYGFIHLLYA